jgi:hypothetical protein
VSEPLATAPPESSFDDIAKLFTAPSAAPSSSAADGPLELIHEGEDILGSSDHDTKTGSAAAANALPVGDETFPRAPDAGAGFQPAFLEGLTTAQSAVPPPAAAPEQVAPPSPAPPPSTATSTPFVTETMAELYVQQGHLDQALEVYRKLVNLHPNDAALAARLREIEAKLSPAARETITAPAATREAVVEVGPTIRDFLGSIAEFRLRSTAASNDRPQQPASPTAELPMLDVGSEPRREGTVAGSLSNLFTDAERRGRADDVRPANREVPSPPPSRDVADEAPSSIRGRPSTPAANELSLDHVFRHATPATGAGKQSSFSFDQFFSQQAQQDVAASDAEPSSEANAGLSDDIQQFNAWLEGLKKT